MFWVGYRSREAQGSCIGFTFTLGCVESAGIKYSNLREAGIFTLKSAEGAGMILEAASYAMGSLFFWFLAAWLGFLVKREKGALFGAALIAFIMTFVAIRAEAIYAEIERFPGVGFVMLGVGLIAAIPYGALMLTIEFEKYPKLLSALRISGKWKEAIFFFAILLGCEFISFVLSLLYASGFLGLRISESLEYLALGRFIIFISVFLLIVTISQLLYQEER